MTVQSGRRVPDTPPAKSKMSAAVRDELLKGFDWERDVVEHSRDLLCIHDLLGNLLSINPAPARILGYSVDEILQIPMRELVPPEFRDQFEEYLRRIARDGEASGLLAVMARSGERRIWEYHNTLRSESGGTPLVRGVAHDLTERMALERQLRETVKSLAETTRGQEVALRELRLFRTLLDNSNDAIEVIDPMTWRFVDMNAKQCDELGYTRNELLQMTISDIDPTATPDVIAQRHKELRDSGSLTIESLHKGKDGSTFPVELNIKSVQLDREYLVVISRNITERKRLEEELQQARDRLAEEKSYLEREIDTELGFEEVIGKSETLKVVMQRAATVATSDATVLLLGETGTGKELIARAVHRLSKRADRAFIKMNCAAIPTGLLESELFGSEKGAFTGAVTRKVGRLELADRGTLFLGEIGELSPVLQPKLLRVLQDREFERLGGTQTLKVNFRLIAATNRDLGKEVAGNRFRSDLYYRLNVFPILIPALRERPDDIPLLVHYFVEKCAHRMGKNITSIPKKTMDALVRWYWPGNVRELENFIERSVILSEGSVLRVPLAELMLEPARKPDIALKTVEREHIMRVLRECSGVVDGPRGAASALGMKRTTLQSKMRRLGIPGPGSRG